MSVRWESLHLSKDGQHGGACPCGRGDVETFVSGAFCPYPFYTSRGWGGGGVTMIRPSQEASSGPVCLVTDPLHGDAETQVLSVCGSVRSQCSESRQRKWNVPSILNESLVCLLAFTAVSCSVLLSFSSSASDRRESHVPWQPTCQLIHQSLLSLGQKENVD